MLKNSIYTQRPLATSVFGAISSESYTQAACPLPLISFPAD